MIKNIKNTNISWYIDNFIPLANPYYETIGNGLFVTTPSGGVTFSRDSGDLRAVFSLNSNILVSNGNADTQSYPRISANSRFTFEIMASGTGTITAGSYMIKFYNSSNSLISFITGSLSTPSTKSQTTATFVTPTNAYFYEIEFSVSANSGAVVRFSDFQLYEGFYRFGGEDLAPDVVEAQVRIVRDRFLAEGLTFPNWKLIPLENLFKQIMIATESTILPDFLILPNLSSDTSAPSSTTLINLGIGSANITINGSTVGSMIQPDHFLFDGVNDWLSSSVSQNGSGVGFTTHARVRSGISTLQNIFGSSTIEACFTCLVNGTFHIARSFDSNDGNGIGRGSSDFVINSDRKYSATYNGSNVVAGIKTYTNGVQADSVNSNTGTFVSSRNTGAGNLVVGTRRNVDSYFSGRIYSAISWIGRELNYGQIQNINNLTIL